jgi:hypothetical protein
VSQQEMIRINKRFFDSIINSNPYSILIKLADRTNNTESSCSSSEHGSAKSKRYVREVELEYLPYAKKHNKYFYNRLRKIIAESRKKS